MKKYFITRYFITRSTLDSKPLQCFRHDQFETGYSLLGFVQFVLSLLHLGGLETAVSLQGHHSHRLLQDEVQGKIFVFNFLYYYCLSQHSHEEYMEWMSNMLTYTDCMVIFTPQELVG